MSSLWKRRVAVAGGRALAERRLSRAWLLLLLPALLLAAAWIGPRLLAWDHYRAQIAEIAGAQLGRSVRIEGPISLTLLPQPQLEANAVAIGAAEDGVTVTARALRLTLALPPLLAGRFAPRELTLVGSEIALPWPPQAVPVFRPPSWLSALNARLEDSRLTLGGLVFEGLNARLIAPGPNEPIRAEGTTRVHQLPLRFSAQLGRAGDDGIAPLDLGVGIAGASISATGLLTPADGFEGRLEAAGPDLGALLTAPALPFRASGRLTATANLFAADALSLELAGEPARGAVSLRLVPRPRLDISLSAGRLDLDAWIAALRVARRSPQAIPLGLDLAAEATGLGGIPLRKLRVSLTLERERLSLSDVDAILPGQTRLALTGTGVGEQLDLTVQFATPGLREALGELGWAWPGLEPGRWQQADGRFRLLLREGQAIVHDFFGSLDGASLSGGGAWRAGLRPFLGIELTTERLDVDALRGLLLEPRALALRTAGVDLNLRIAADAARWKGETATRAGIDLSIENGRLAVRRLGFRLGEVEWLGHGAAQLGNAPRLLDSVLELNGPSGAALAPFLPAALAPLLAERLALKLSAGGAAEALALSGEAEFGDLRLEGSGTLDLAAERGSGTLTARHPGAPRLLAPWIGSAVNWLGEGSFAAVGSLSGSATQLTAEQLDLVIGTLRGRGQLSLMQDSTRPRLRGRFQAESLPLPPIRLDDTTPLAFGRLADFDAELVLEAGLLDVPGLAALREARATMKLEAGTLRVDAMEARLSGGSLRGQLLVESMAAPPRLVADLQLTDATLAGPLFGQPVDLSAGRLGGEAQLTALGHSPAGLLATLSGTAMLGARDGVLVGLDLGAAAAAAARSSLAEAEAGLRDALASGATAFEMLNAVLRIADGQARITESSAALIGGSTASSEGTIDFAHGRLDLRLLMRPIAEAPMVGLRLTGPVAAPRRLLELSDFLRWRAEH